MAILNIETAQPAGLTSVIPNLIYVNTSDTYAEVTATGFLTAQASQGYTFSNEQMALVYTSDEGAVWLKVVITYSGSSVLNTVVSLVQISSPGDVTLPTVASNLIKSTDTVGTLADSGVAVADVQLNTNIIAAQTADIGGAGAGPITVTVTGLTAASVVVATIVSSSNTVSVAKVTPGTADFDILFDADPGAACVVSYVALVAAQ